MQRYKTIVLDFRKVAKGISLFLISSVVSFSAFKILGKGISSDNSTDEIISNEIPVIDVVTNSFNLSNAGKNILSKASGFLLGFDINDSNSIIKSAIPMYSTVFDAPLSVMARQNVTAEPIQKTSSPKLPQSPETVEEKTVYIPEENQADIKCIDASQKATDENPISIGNETSYSIDIKSMLAKKPSITPLSSLPKILITHTHATEAYADEGAAVYDTKASDRSEDNSKNVIAVGNELQKALEANDVTVIHDLKQHDVPSFNGSYADSLASIEDYLEKYPSIEIVFDVHRDSIVYDDETKAKEVTEINGRSAAQLMFVVGTDEKGLYNPDWRDNLTAAIHFQDEVIKKYPHLMRHINLRKERFNGHTSHASMIIEVGTSGNCLSEAKYSMTLFGKCIADYLKTIR